MDVKRRVSRPAAWVALAVLAGWAAVAGDAPARPLRVHMVTGSKEYRAEESLRAFVPFLESRFPVRCTFSAARDAGTEMPGIEALKDADVLVVFCRRVRVPDAEWAILRAWFEAEKPVVGIRTASHAFNNMPDFDREILGGDYRGHGNAADVLITPTAAGRQHPVSRGYPGKTRPGKLYRNAAPAPDITVLLTGEAEGEAHPVAWTRAYGPNRRGRVFYTSLGTPADFADRDFREMLAEAIRAVAGPDSHDERRE